MSADAECYCQPDIEWVCHHHENAKVPHNPVEDELAVKEVLRLRGGAGGRHSCTCVECRAIVRVAAMARERITMGGARSAKKKHRAALREALHICDHLEPSEDSARLRECLRSVYGCAPDTDASRAADAVDPASGTRADSWSTPQAVESVALTPKASP